MRLPEYEIPTDYQLFDDTTHGADKFANVRDMQVLRKNHNIALAKRAKRPIFMHRYSAGGSVASSYQYVLTTRAPSTSTGAVLLRTVVWVGQQTQQLRLVMYAARGLFGDPESEFDFEPEVYPVLHPLHVMREIDPSTKITVSGALFTLNKYSVDFPVPHTYDESDAYSNGRMAFELDLYVRCAVDDTASGLLYSGVAVSSVGSNWVEPGAALGASAVMAMLYSTTNPRMEPRLIIKRDTGLGANGRYYVDRPFNTAISSSDTISVRQIMGLAYTSVCVYELPVTDFHPDAVGAG